MYARTAVTIWCLINPQWCLLSGPFYGLSDQVYDGLQRLMDEYNATDGRIQPATLRDLAEAFDASGKPDVALQVIQAIPRIVEQINAENQNILAEARALETQIRGRLGHLDVPSGPDNSNSLT